VSVGGGAARTIAPVIAPVASSRAGATPRRRANRVGPFVAVVARSARVGAVVCRS
jgi:hypothetical protein